MHININVWIIIYILLLLFKIYLKSWLFIFYVYVKKGFVEALYKNKPIKVTPLRVVLKDIEVKTIFKYFKNIYEPHTA